MGKQRSKGIKGPPASKHTVGQHTNLPMPRTESAEFLGARL